MAYALLASLPPVYGLYTSFFPVLFYWIFGTSRHISMGTFSATAPMISSILANLEQKYVPPVGFNRTTYGNILLNKSNESDIPCDTSLFLSDNRNKALILIAMACTFWVGIIQILMFIFQLGFLTTYLSEPFINSFLAGCAVHNFTSQLRFLFGIHLTRFTGLFQMPKVYNYSFENKSSF